MSEWFKVMPPALPNWRIPASSLYDLLPGGCLNRSEHLGALGQMHPLQGNQFHELPGSLPSGEPIG